MQDMIKRKREGDELRNYPRAPTARNMQDMIKRRREGDELSGKEKKFLFFLF
jgi:hypothetical protein